MGSLRQSQHSHQSRLTGLPHRLEGFSMVRVYPRPSLLHTHLLHTLVDEVASVSEATEALLGEGVTALGLVGPIVLHIDPEILGAVGELALLGVGTGASIHEVLAEGALGLGGGGAVGEDDGGGEAIMGLHFFSFGGGLGFDVAVGREAGVGQGKRMVHGQV